VTNHTLEKTRWLVATSLTFGNSIKIDSFSSHTPKVYLSSQHPSFGLVHFKRASVVVMGGQTAARHQH